jgi:hypothetical protein
MPEYGRFIFRDIEQIIFQAHSNIKALTPYFSDKRFIHKDGNYRWAQERLKVFSEENGAV